MKILYIAKFDFPHSTENYITHALEQLGCEVVKRCYRSCDFAGATDTLVHGRYDFVLFSKPSAPCFPELIRWCRVRRITTVTWVFDLFFGYRSLRPPQFLADLAFSTDGGHQDQFRELRGDQLEEHRVLRQGIHEPHHRLIRDSYENDLVFVGDPSTYRWRRRFIQHLAAKYGDAFKVVTNTRGMELNRLLGKTRVVVGDTYPSREYWSNRVYEMLGRGAFLLFPPTEGLGVEFTADEHYVEMPRDFTQASEVIDRWIDPSMDEKREAIRSKGWKRRGLFTYAERCRELLCSVHRFKERGSYRVPSA